MFGRDKTPAKRTYFAVYTYEYTTSANAVVVKAPDDLAALTTAKGLVGTEYGTHKLIGVLRSDGGSVQDFSESERHTADLERELGIR
jgi:hypothetical protein